MINTAKVEKSLFGKGYYENKEHLFAQILLERSEEIRDLTLEQLQTKIKVNFGVAALAILQDLFHEMDISYFIEHNEIKSLFELSNYAKLGYGDHQIRRRLLTDLGINYYCAVKKSESSTQVNLELLVYVCDAIAFLSKNKIQFVEDFGALFPVAEAQGTNESELDTGKYDLVKRVRLQTGQTTSLFDLPERKTLRVREFSAELQDAAYHDLTAGSYKAPIPGFKSRRCVGGPPNLGESVYWDSFFWLRPGSWLRKNLQYTTVII
jgi:hypothetical protein